MTKDNQEEYDALRGHLEEAPTLGGEGTKAGTEIKVRRSPWVVRGLIIVFALALAVEAFFISEYRKEAIRIVVNLAPAVRSYPAPPVGAESVPPIEAASIDNFVEEPTPFPLPEELEGIEYPVFEE
mgnify:CR=1 FL=1